MSANLGKLEWCIRKEIPGNPARSMLQFESLTDVALPCAAVAVDESAGGRVPYVHALVEGAGGDVLPVRGECHRVDGLLHSGINTELYNGNINDARTSNKENSLAVNADE